MLKNFLNKKTLDFSENCAIITNRNDLQQTNNRKTKV